MNENLRFVLALAAFLAVVAGLELVAGYAVFHALEADEKERVVRVLAPKAELVGEIGLLLLAILGIAFAVAYQYYVKGALKIAEGIRIALNANSSHRLELAGPSELKRLTRAVNDLAEHGEMLARDLEAKVARAKSSVEEEKNRLAALMSELTQGVLVCNADGRILLYNERARQTLCAPDGAQTETSMTLVGLGRSIFTIIDRNLLAHALENIRARLEKDEPGPSAQLVFTTRAGQLIRVRLAPVVAAPEAPPGGPESESRHAVAEGSAVPAPSPFALGGFVMTLENVTHTFELDSTRDMLLQSLTEGSRAALANIRAAVETLTDYPDCDPVHRDRFLQVIREEARALSGRLDKTTSDYADSLKTRWPLEEMLGIDAVAAARRRIESRLGLRTLSEVLDDSIWIKADSYTLVQAFSYLAGRLKEGYEVRELCFNLRRHARIAELDLAWSEPILSQGVLYDWETDTMRAGGEDSPLTLRDVTDRLGAEVVYMVDKQRQRPFIRFLLPMAKPTRASVGVPIRFDESRPEFYDFDLFHQAGQTPELDQLPLAELAYTVIDTETTGLDPSAGDEIIAIGAVRIVNNRLLRYETYEQLVDPKRPIAASSQTVHGISHEMLRGQPVLDQVLPQFHEYCEDTVLVGHNAAFDMRFLQVKEAQTGIRFTQPVLDTLLLSQVLHPNQESHALEAIAERLGVAVVARHTALGDALVTGEVFLRMIPLLAAHGIRSLRDAREATEKALYAKVDY
ncbi:MAG TPA: exonuclease domain-containing protein [Candidatus Competibacter sp.]|nr:DNA polymerase III subunit epsilon [Candidatus Competibacteraceae bacterium]HRC71282.1 exonuclease domain-containing protein [Candidatus Competibacter sp.]